MIAITSDAWIDGKMAGHLSLLHFNFLNAILLAFFLNIENNKMFIHQKGIGCDAGRAFVNSLQISW